jgi:type I restriction enzyme S subunit
MIGRFLAYQLKNYEGTILQIAQYTTLPIMNQTKLGYLPVVQPPIDEQNLVCDYLDDKELEIAKVENSLERQIQTLNAYRKSLIHECITGKRRINQADLSKVEAHV